MAFRPSAGLIIFPILVLVLASGLMVQGSSPDDRELFCSAQKTIPRTGEERGDLQTGEIVVKLKAEAVRNLPELPEDALPLGFAPLRRFAENQGIRQGHRVMRLHGVPVGDPEAFARLGLDRIYVLKLPSDSPSLVYELIGLLRREPWVEYAEPSTRPTFLARIPNDPEFPNQWPFHNTGQTGGKVDADMDAPEAWDIETGDSGAVVGIIDGGPEVGHEDLVGSFTSGWDFIDDDPDPSGSDMHGTGMAGVVSGNGDNGIGVAGGCWDCSVAPLRIATTPQIADALRWAADNGVPILNMSFSFSYATYLQEAVEYAFQRGVLLIAASGNIDGYSVLVPAGFPQVLSVTGTNEFDVRWGSYGEHIDVAGGAPNRTTYPGNSYGGCGGTSCSAPAVAALAGLLLSHDPGLQPREIGHLIRLGAEDGVGTPAEDTPGWDSYMGFGRVNAQRSFERIHGPWITFDEPHYMCHGTVTVALKDESSPGAVPITLTGSLGGDSETILLDPVTAGGYHEGTLALSWAGKDGPVIPGNGKLDVQHGENITATAGSLSTTSFLDCIKRACVSGKYRHIITGDCDNDGALDPGELWALELTLSNYDSPVLPGVVVTASTSNPNITLVRSRALYGVLPADQSMGYIKGTFDDQYPLLLRVESGSPANAQADFTVVVEGDGWEQDTAACNAAGDTNSFSLSLNRDNGTTIKSWTFDAGVNQGFTHAARVGNDESDLVECYDLTPWGDAWQTNPVTDKAQSGTYSMRLGTGAGYPGHLDGSLVTPQFSVPAGGGSLGFYLWASSAVPSYAPRLAVDGMVLEAKATSSSKWTYLNQATYNTNLYSRTCFPTVNENFPFGETAATKAFSGDGAGTLVLGDTFDRQHIVDLSAFAGKTIQVRFRFGADNVNNSESQGVWIDTVKAYGAFVADTWPGTAPANLTGSPARCPENFDLSWSPVSGAGGYTIYRSAVSCDDAQRSLTPYGTSSTANFSDTAATSETPFYYAVEANQAGSGCPTARSCVSGYCPCAIPADPEGLLLARVGADLDLEWDDPGQALMTWNIYRESAPDPDTWGPPHAEGVTDQNPGKPGIQYTDAGASSGAPLFFYFITAVKGCESPLP